MQSIDLSANVTDRLKQARALTVQNITNLCKDQNINVLSYRFWENGKINLNLKRAKICCHLFEKFNVVCNPEWLLTGNGQPPFIKGECDEKILDMDIYNSIKPEIDALKNQFPNIIIQIIKDNSSAPFYNKGDYIACLEIDRQSINVGTSYNCMINRFKHSPTVYKKVYVTEIGSVLVNLDECGEIEIIYNNQHVHRFAQIIWHRIVS